MLLFQNMKLRTKLISGFIIVAIITLIVGIIGWIGISRLGTKVQDIGSNNLPSIQALLTIDGLMKNIDSVQQTLCIRSLSSIDLKEHYDKIDKNWTALDEQWQKYNGLYRDQSIIETKKMFDPLYEKWKNDIDEFVRIFAQYTDSTDPKTQEVLYNRLLNQGLNVSSKSFDQVEPILLKLIDESDKSNFETIRRANFDTNFFSVLSIIGMLMGTLLALTIGIVLSNSISKPMNSAVAQLNEGAGQVAAASNQLSSAAQQLSQGSASKHLLSKRPHQPYRNRPLCYSKILLIPNKHLNFQDRPKNPPIKAATRCRK